MWQELTLLKLAVLTVWILTGSTSGVQTEFTPYPDGEECGERALRDDQERCYSSPDADPGRGRWRKCRGGIKDSPVRVTDPPPVHFGFYGTCDKIWHKRNDVEQPYWEWESEGCFLESVNATKFCKVMEKRKGILFVGDSLSRLMSKTLALILGADSVKATLMDDLWKGCDGQIPVRFLRNDYLDTRTVNTYPQLMCEHVNGQPPLGSKCGVFAKNDTLIQYDTIVVNSGAHVRDMDEYVPEMLKSSSIIAERMRRLHGEDAVMIFRNTIPGHPECTRRRFNGPLDEAVALNLVRNSSELLYGWDTFSARNELVEPGFRSNGWKILDAYTPTLLRADAHIGGKDCLHYCIPGPADHWVVLLYNMLVAHEERSYNASI